MPDSFLLCFGDSHHQNKRKMSLVHKANNTSLLLANIVNSKTLIPSKHKNNSNKMIYKVCKYIGDRSVMHL